MDEHDDSKPMTVAELRAHAKKWFDENFENDGDMYVDAFSNGAYHEEEPLWYLIAEKLPNEDLTRLALSTVHILIRGSVDHREGPTLEKIMAFTDALRKWMDGHLKVADEILLPLTAFREILIASAVEEGRGWWIDHLRAFSLVDFAIHRRMGMWTSDIEYAYTSAMEKCARVQ
jgi:hypothetical protein